MSLYIGPWQEMRFYQWIKSNQRNQVPHFSLFDRGVTQPKPNYLSGSGLRRPKPWEKSTECNILCNFRLKKNIPELSDTSDKINDTTQTSQKNTLPQPSRPNRSDISALHDCIKNDIKRSRQSTKRSGNNTYTCCEVIKNVTKDRSSGYRRNVRDNKKKNEANLDRVRQMRRAYTVREGEQGEKKEKAQLKSGRNSAMEIVEIFAQPNKSQSLLSPTSILPILSPDNKPSTIRKKVVKNQFGSVSQPVLVEGAFKTDLQQDDEEIVMDNVDMLIQWAQQLTMDAIFIDV